MLRWYRIGYLKGDSICPVIDKQVETLLQLQYIPTGIINQTMQKE